MNTGQIEYLLSRHCGSSFNGVYACDRLPKSSVQDGIYVCNTDPVDQPGEHWVVVWIDGERSEYFDSYGLKPYIRQIADFVHANAKIVKYNNVSLQGPSSQVCGHYAIFFAVCKSKCMSMETVLSMFSSDRNMNDLKVYEYICNLANYCI